MKTRYDWIPDLPDYRDHLFASRPDDRALLPSVDLAAKLPPVFDQGNLGSCTANALAAQLSFIHPEVPNFSRLFIYRGERAMEKTVHMDAGAMIRDGVKYLNKSGCCPEFDWPYVISHFTAKPTVKAYQDAKAYRIKGYQRLQSLLHKVVMDHIGVPLLQLLHEQ